MKKLKKILSIVVILFLIIMLSSDTQVYATAGGKGKKSKKSKKSKATTEEETSFFEDVFEDGKKWEERGEEGSDNIINKANSAFKNVDEFYNIVRVIGAGIFVVAITATGVALSMNNSGVDMAGYKMAISFIFILAVLFIFAQPLMEFISGLFDALEDTI